MKTPGVSCIVNVQVQQGRLPPKHEVEVTATVQGKEIYLGSKYKIKAKEISGLRVNDNDSLDNNNTTTGTGTGTTTTPSSVIIETTSNKHYLLEQSNCMVTAADAFAWKTFLTKVQALAQKYQPNQQFATFLQSSATKAVGASSSTAAQRRRRTNSKTAAVRRTYGSNNNSAKMVKSNFAWGPDDEFEFDKAAGPKITPVSDTKDDDVTMQDAAAQDSTNEMEEDFFPSKASSGRGRLRKRLQNKRLKSSGGGPTFDDTDSEDDALFSDDPTFTTPAAQRVVSPSKSTLVKKESTKTGAGATTGDAEENAAPNKNQPTLSKFFSRRTKTTTAAPSTPERPSPSPARSRSLATSTFKSPIRSAQAARIVRSGKRRVLKSDDNWLHTSPAAKSPAKQRDQLLFGSDKPAWRNKPRSQTDVDDILEFSPTKTARSSLKLQPRKRIRHEFGKQRSSLSPPRNNRLTLEFNNASSSALTTVASTAVVVHKPKQLFRGLRNLGNTCYLNASLQMLYTYRQFVSSLRPRCSAGPLTSSIVETADLLTLPPDKNAMTNNNGAVNPKAVKEAMDDLTDKFEGFKQRDAHEFLSDLVDNIHEELEQNEDETVKKEGEAATKALPTDDFCLTVQVCLKCNSCGYSRSKDEIYRHLSIDIVSNEDENIKSTVEQSLKQFFQPETREIKCEKCKDGVDAQQTIQILSRPNALLLHLKRFIVEERWTSTPDSENSQPNSPNAAPPAYELVFKKNKAPVIIAPAVSLDAFALKSETEQAPTAADAATVTKKEYKLQSIVHHLGARASNGHYTADAIRLVDKEATDELAAAKEEKWFIFDDGRSYATTFERISGNIKKQSSAYMLLYTLKDDDDDDVESEAKPIA